MSKFLLNYFDYYLISIIYITDMLPERPDNIMELICECFFLNDFSKEQRNSLRIILGSKHVGGI